MSEFVILDLSSSIKWNEYLQKLPLVGYSAVVPGLRMVQITLSRGQRCFLNPTAPSTGKACGTQQSLWHTAKPAAHGGACTLADLDQSENIKPRHLKEAVDYRTLDRQFWTWKESLAN